MITDFYISEKRYNECKSFIRSLSSARFNGNPIKVGDKWNINLTLEVSDANKLSKVLSFWCEADKPKVKTNFITRLLS